MQRFGLFDENQFDLSYLAAFFLSAMFYSHSRHFKRKASGSNMRAHAVHALYSSVLFCNTPLIWLCMKAVAKDLGCVLLLDSE